MIGEPGTVFLRLMYGAISIKDLGGAGFNGGLIKIDQQGNQIGDSWQQDAADFWIPTAGVLVFSGLELSQDYLVWADANSGDGVIFLDGQASKVRLSPERPMITVDGDVITLMQLNGPVGAASLQAIFLPVRASRRIVWCWTLVKSNFLGPPPLVLSRMLSPSVNIVPSGST